MAMQGIWSGTISFSLVAIPVQLVRAIAPGRVSFRLLHGEDYSPLARKMFCPEQEKTVAPDEIVRGYEIAPERYIPVTDEELESVSPERSRTIEIVEFIDMVEMDPLFFDHPYFLVPAKGGEKAYRLLTEVMARANRVGLAKFVLAEREYLVAVRSVGGALALITLHYSEDLLSAEAPKQGKAEAAQKSRMKKSIREMMTEFNPEKYADERRRKVMALLERKAKEQAPVTAPVIEEAEGEGPADLMAALTEAMAQVKKNR